MTDDTNEREAKIIGLVPGESDQVKADRLKTKVADACGPMIALMNEAASMGFELNMAIKTNALGQAYIDSIAVTKKL